MFSGAGERREGALGTNALRNDFKTSVSLRILRSSKNRFFIEHLRKVTSILEEILHLNQSFSHYYWFPTTECVSKNFYMEFRYRNDISSI